MAVSKQRLLNSLACIALIVCTAPAMAEGLEFRVDTELFKNDEKKPILEQLTIFGDDGTVYDFCLTEPPETTVFDPRHGRFTLLDETRKVKAIVTTQELLDYSLALETYAAQQKDPLFAFCAAARFETAVQEIQHNGQAMTELRLSAKPLSYTALGLKAQKPEAAKAYRHFTDWCARLNSTRSGNLPANARLVLNGEFADRGLLPFEITRTIPKLILKSEHRVNWALAGQDRKKIERAGDMMATFAAVSYDEYRSADSKPAPAASTKQARR